MKYIVCPENKKIYNDYKRNAEKSNNILVYKENISDLYEYLDYTSVIPIAIDDQGNVKDNNYSYLEKDIKNTIEKNYGIINSGCSFYVETNANIKYIAVVVSMPINVEFWSILSIKNLVFKSNRNGITNIKTIIIPNYFCIDIYKNISDAIKSEHNNDFCEEESEIYYVFSDTEDAFSDTSSDDSEFILDEI